jgi:hypothetical protein
MPLPRSAVIRLLKVVATASTTAAVSAGALAGPSASPAGAASSTSVQSTIVQQADWILEAQLPDGAIAVWPDRPVLRTIWPYLANMAATGLARATQVTGDQTYAGHAWQYLDWYASVEQPSTGYVTDYTIQNGTTPVSNGNIDSTDAYAGTFLSAAWDTYAVTQDKKQLQALAGGIAGALHAIESTQQPDGLTWAKPSWQVAYLMDNAQALSGLDGAAALEQALGNTQLAADAANHASAMSSGIASLWNPATGAYNWAKQPDGWEHPNDWSNFYPDAMEQASAVAWGAVTGTRAAALMSAVEAHHPDWTNPSAVDNYLNGSTVQQQAVSYWPMVGMGFGAVGNTALDTTGVGSILNAAAAVQWGWPYTTGDAGNAIVALSGLPYLNPTGSGTGTHHKLKRGVTSPTPPTATTGVVQEPIGSPVGGTGVASAAAPAPAAAAGVAAAVAVERTAAHAGARRASRHQAARHQVARHDRTSHFRVAGIRRPSTQLTSWVAPTREAASPSGDAATLMGLGLAAAVLVLLFSVSSYRRRRATPRWCTSPTRRSR